jgi:hypothetical protein
VNHLLTMLGALSTFLSTGLHCLIVFERFTRLGTLCAGLFTKMASLTLQARISGHEVSTLFASTYTIFQSVDMTCFSMLAAMLLAIAQRLFTDTGARRAFDFAGRVFYRLSRASKLQITE